MMHEHITVSDDLEEVERLLTVVQLERRSRDPRLVFQVWTVDGHERPQSGEVDQPVDLDDRIGVDLELLDQHELHVGGHARRHFESHRASESAATELGLDGLKEVFGFLLIDVEVRVASDSERKAGIDLQPRKQLGKVSGDEILDGKPAALIGEPDEARQQRRDLHACKTSVPRRRVVHGDGEIEREIRDVGERMPRIDRQGRQNGKDAIVKELVQVVAVVAVETAPRHHVDAGITKSRNQLISEEGGVPIGQVGRGAMDERKLGRRAESVGGTRVHTGGDLGAQRSSAYLEELVEVRSEDRTKLDSLQERRR